MRKPAACGRKAPKRQPDGDDDLAVCPIRDARDRQTRKRIDHDERGPEQKAHFGIVDRQGNVHYQGSIPTTDYEDFKDFFDGMADALREAIHSLGKDAKVVGIGVGAANGNYYTGTIDQATNLKWKEELPLAKMFTDEFAIPCVLTNDANAAAVGEMVYGNAKGMKDFVVITLGTGLGSGFVCNGAENVTPENTGAKTNNKGCDQCARKGKKQNWTGTS